MQSSSPPLLEACHVPSLRVVERIRRPHQCSHPSPRFPLSGPPDATSLEALYLPMLCTSVVLPVASPAVSPALPQTKACGFFYTLLLLAQWVCLTTVSPGPSPPVPSREEDHREPVAGSALGSVMDTAHPVLPQACQRSIPSPILEI